jgi:hypothetical protein
VIPLILRVTTLEAAMMGRRDEQWSLFYQFRLDERVPKDHLLRRIDRFVTVAAIVQLDTSPVVPSFISSVEY